MGTVARARLARLATARLAVWAVLALLASALAGCLPSGFQESTVYSGLDAPTKIRFAPNGDVFVAEKSGRVKRFDGLDDKTPTVVADLHKQVYNYWDRGLLGMAVSPGYDGGTDQRLYLSYTYDSRPFDTSPAGAYDDACPNPPGPVTAGCEARGRLVSVNAGDSNLSDQAVLLTDWCQQFPSHSVGDVAFAPDGRLLMSAGEGANFNTYNLGDPGDTAPNTCGDPPSEGGMLRAQDRETGGDPLGLDGSIIRVDPTTGSGVPGNPGYSAPGNDNRSRIIAYGLRNPFRFALRPGTSELWQADVGWNRYERIFRLPSTTPSTAANFGWPCYENESRGLTSIPICAGLYANPSRVTAPYFAYAHDQRVVAGNKCGEGASGSVTGIAFAPSGARFSAAYDGALFFADYSHGCIYAMRAGAGGNPDPARREVFSDKAPTPVDLQFGPTGDLFYVDFSEGKVQRITYPVGKQAPVVAIQADRQDVAPLPKAVGFTSTGTSDPDNSPGALRYSWDLDGDGSFGDSTSPSPSYTYTQSRDVAVRLKVTDGDGLSATSAPLVVRAGNTPPSVAVTSPDASALRWEANQQLAFAGTAIDPEDGTLAASAMDWSLDLHHCPSSCHVHPLQGFTGPSGAFVAPDHEYPAYLTLSLKATDTRGATATQTVRLDPRTVSLDVATEPPGLSVSLNADVVTAPAQATVIAGSLNTVTAADQGPYRFSAWSDDGAASHQLRPLQDTSLTARFEDTTTGGPSSSKATPSPGAAPSRRGSSSPRDAETSVPEPDAGGLPPDEPGR